MISSSIFSSSARKHVRSIQEQMENSTVNADYITSVLTENQFIDLNTKKLFFFKIAIRGVLNFIVQFIATFLNLSTILAISKYKELQVTSNALVVCFSIGNSLAVVNGTLAIATDFVLEINSKTWKVVCTVLGSFLLFQQFNNVLSITAISFERMYSIFFPFHSYKHNTFEKMAKVSIFILVLSFVAVSTSISVGFIIGNFNSPQRYCGYTAAVGATMMRYVVPMLFFIFSTLSLLATGSITVKLILLKRNRSIANASATNVSEYKITKMLVTGRYILFFNSVFTYHFFVAIKIQIENSTIWILFNLHYQC